MKINPGPLNLENVDHQFCSDWLKDEIRRVLKERDDLKYLLTEINKHVMPGECDSVDGMLDIIRERDDLCSKIQGWENVCLEQAKERDAAIQRAEQWQAYAGKLRGALEEIATSASPEMNDYAIGTQRRRIAILACKLPNPDETSRGEGG